MARDIPLLQGALAAINIEFQKQGSVVGIWEQKLSRVDTRLGVAKDRLEGSKQGSIEGPGSALRYEWGA